MISLKRRGLAVGVLWACAFSVALTVVLFRYVENQTLRSFDNQLRARHMQLAVAVFESDGDLTYVRQQMSEGAHLPNRAVVHWQVRSDTGRFAKSRTLGNDVLPTPDTFQPKLALRSVDWLDGTELRVTSQILELNDRMDWSIQVAQSVSGLRQENAMLFRRLNVGIFISVVFASVGAVLLVLFALRPLELLREEMSGRWSDGSTLSMKEFPSEIHPLIASINELLLRNRQIVGRSRRQAADLAHAIKTPSSILRNELESLQRTGSDVEPALQALDRLDNQLSRGLAKIRTDQGSSAERTLTDISAAANRMARAFVSLAQSQGKRLEYDISPDLSVIIDRQDFEEIVGNLLDNALKWCRSTVKFEVGFEGRDVVVSISDDGPGIPENDRSRVVEALTRLDEGEPGTGLGLSIARDLAKAHKGGLSINDSSELGGALVQVRLPATLETRIAFV